MTAWTAGAVSGIERYWRRTPHGLCARSIRVRCIASRRACHALWSRDLAGTLSQAFIPWKEDA